MKTVSLLVGLVILATFSPPSKAWLHRLDEDPRTCEVANGKTLKNGDVWYRPDACERYTCEITDTEIRVRTARCAMMNVRRPLRPAY